MSSSEKSMEASNSVRRDTICPRNGEIASRMPPRSCRRAARAAPSVLAVIRSASASAGVRSILPFRKARRENSPGAAGIAPRAHAAAAAHSTSTGFPCRWISATSSPVKLLGAGKKTTRPESISSPLPSRTVHRVSARDGTWEGFTPVMRQAMGKVSGPERRRMETAPEPAGGGGGGDRAAGAPPPPPPPSPRFVARARGRWSSTGSSLGSGEPPGPCLRPGRLFRFGLPVLDQLLSDGKQVVHQPVDRQSRREPPEHEGEDDGQKEHHLLLGRVHPRGRRQLLLEEHRDPHEQGKQADRDRVPRHRDVPQELGGGQVVDPEEERGVPELDRHEEPLVERDEDRDLEEHREAAAHGVDLVRLVEIHHLLLLPRLVVLVLLLDLGQDGA